MKQTLLFAPTLREMPKEAEAISHKILLRGGYIKQNAAGVYTYMPLGYRVIKKIENIIREELDKIGCSELLMPTLQTKDLWIESGRWEAYGKELMRIKDRHDREFCLGPTHEEVITSIVRDFVTSYKKLPLALYQIQTKFRDEFRPRFGLMRGREFIMKDLYTFSATQEDLDDWYLKVRKAYQNIMDRLELHYRIVRANSGAIGGNSSEEFMVLCDIGEDTIVYSDSSDFAGNTELYDLKEGDPSPDGVGTIKTAKGIEAGHIFKLGTKYSEPLKAMFIDKDGKQKPIIMGCYGIGVSRVMMAVIEQNNDENGMIWPKSIAPFDVHVVPVDVKKADQLEAAEKIYADLKTAGFDVLLDDRKERAGVKFSDADLIGLPIRVTVGRGIADGLVEVKVRQTGEVAEVAVADLMTFVQEKYETLA